MSYDSGEYVEPKKLSKLAWTLLVVLVLAILVGGFFSVKSVFFSEKPDPNASGYSAVFLSNGQVYFGTIASQNDRYLVLKDIFYLQAVQSLQGGQAQTQPFTLIKLGQELHGPTDTMYISRPQILFYENMRNDSSIVKSIENYKNQ